MEEARLATGHRLADFPAKGRSGSQAGPSLPGWFPASLVQ